MYKRKATKLLKCGSAIWWRLYKTIKTVKHHIRAQLPYRPSFAAEQLLEEIREGKLLGYVKCDIEVAENLKTNFANFPPIYMNTLFSKSDIWDLMKNYAEEEGFLCQPQRMLIFSFTLQNGTLSTPLLLFYLQLGLVCKKYAVLLSTLQRNASTVLCSQQWTQEGKVAKVQTQVSSPKQ